MKIETVSDQVHKKIIPQQLREFETKTLIEILKGWVQFSEKLTG